MQYLIQKVLQLKDLDRLLCIVSLLLFFSSSYIANYYSVSANTAWKNFAIILRFDFLLILVSLRTEVKKLIGNTWYKIAIYTIINNFIDRYFDIIVWSWNDYLTVIGVLFELLVSYVFKKFNIKSIKK